MPHESPAVDAVTRLAELPGIPEQVEVAREACTRLRWHQALRRRIPEAAAESRVRGAVASGELEGASVPVDVVRDIARGASTWSPSPDPVEVTVRGVLAATAETEHVLGVVLTAPLQALARLHAAAATGLVPDDALGRPRLEGEPCGELTDLGPAPEAAEVTRAAALGGRGAAGHAPAPGGRGRGRGARRAGHRASVRARQRGGGQGP